MLASCTVFDFCSLVLSSRFLFNFKAQMVLRGALNFKRVDVAKAKRRNELHQAILQHGSIFQELYDQLAAANVDIFSATFSLMIEVNPWHQLLRFVEVFTYLLLLCTMSVQCTVVEFIYMCFGDVRLAACSTCEASVLAKDLKTSSDFLMKFVA